MRVVYWGFKEVAMQFKAIVAAAIITAAVFGMPGSQPVRAGSQTTNNKVKAVQTKRVANMPKVVIVKPGDYLSKIAKTNHTTYPRMFDANPQIKNPDLIYPGQKLKVPAKNEKLRHRKSLAPNYTKPVSPPVKSYRSSNIVPYQPPTTHYSLPSNVGIWDQLAQCESGGNWSINTGNGFYGGLQFTLSSWWAVGGSGYPNLASKAEQIARAKILQSMQGWGAWPACSAKLGL